MNNSWLCRCSRSDKDCQGGMTLLELLIAVLMLMTFTGVVVMVMEFSLRFLGDTDLTEEEMNDPDANANGVLIDHGEALYSMDQLVEVLSQPAISNTDLVTISSGVNRCSINPVQDWGLPMSNIGPPFGYQFCLSTTSAIEDDWDTLLANGKPGIYMLQALPDGPPDPSMLPVRRLFCRPRPFC